MTTDSGADVSGQADYLVDFGTVAINTIGRNEVKIRNRGNTALQLRSEGAEAPFRMTLPSAGVPGSAEASIVFEYAPTEPRDVKDQYIVEIATNEEKGTKVHKFRIVGQAVKPGLICDPEVLDFGSVVRDEVKTLPLVCTNTLDVAVQMERSISGNSREHFTAAVEGGVDEVTTVPANGTVTLLVSFQAPVEGQHDATLAMVDPSGNPLANVDLLAFASRSALLLEPQTCLDFGYRAKNETDEKFLNIRNIGTENVRILGFRIPTDYRDQYSVTTAAPITLEPGDTKEIGVAFHPTRGGPINTTIEIETDDLRDGIGTLDACVSGFGGGPQLACSPEAIDFGLVAVDMPVTRTFRCTNVGEEPTGTPIDPLFVEAPYSDLPQFEPTIRNWRDGSLSPRPEGYEVDDYFFVDVVYNPIDDNFDSASIMIDTQSAVGGTYEMGVSGEGRNLPPCNFTLTPATLNFGTVDRGGTLTQGFGITNNLETSCLINDLHLSEDSDPAYSLEPIESYELGPFATLKVEVTFAPTQYQPLILGKAVFQISNKDNPNQEVVLRGTSAKPCLVIDPPVLDFGKVEPDCNTRDRFVGVSNVCTEPVTVVSVEVNDTADAGAFKMSQRPILPRTLNPNERDEFTMKFNPDDYGQFSGAVRVDTASGETYMAALLGEGAMDANQTDVFNQKDRPKVDILWVMDNSGSFTPYQNMISANLPSFLTFANAQTVDYHIAVTTTGLINGGNCPGGANGAEDGRFFPIDGSRPRILTPSTPDLDAVWAANIRVGDCHWDEQPFEAAKRALSPPLINEVKSSQHNSQWDDGNAGFLRKDASLSIILVTDEADHAYELGIPNSQPADYVDFYKSIKGARNENMFKLHAITTPSTGQNRTCGVDYGDRINWAVEATEGTWIDICTPQNNDAWGAGLEAMSKGAFGFSARFNLRGMPGDVNGDGRVTEDDIEVFVDGFRTPPRSKTGARVWTYDPITISVDFTPLFIPKPGSQLSATYKVACLSN